jgi:hypothetical protein
MVANSIASPELQTTGGSRATATRRYMKWLPSAFWLLAAVLLLVSLALPYWGLILKAPQYPNGLRIRVFATYMTGDEDPKLDEVREIDGLNHYIGMHSLYTAAQVERAIALPAIFIMAALLAVAALWRRRWTWLLTIPALSFPFVFLADLGLWMRFYGQDLDPSAPLSSSIYPFIPTLLGEGVIAQFKTIAYVDRGWYIAVAGCILIVVAIVIRLLDKPAKAQG